MIKLWMILLILWIQCMMNEASVGGSLRQEIYFPNGQ
jgi:hypothetical protein